MRRFFQLVEPNYLFLAWFFAGLIPVHLALIGAFRIFGREGLHLAPGLLWFAALSLALPVLHALRTGQIKQAKTTFGLIFFADAMVLVFWPAIVF